MASTRDFESPSEGSTPSTPANSVDKTLDDQLTAWEKRLEERKKKEAEEEAEEERKRAEQLREGYVYRRGGSDPELYGKGDAARRAFRKKLG